MINIIKKTIIIIIVIFITIVLLLPKQKNELSKLDNYVINPHKITGTNTLRIALEENNNKINPLYDDSTSVSLLSRFLYSSIIKKDKNNDIILDAAKQYWYENDGKTIAVILKNNLKFNDNEYLNAYSILNTYKMLASPYYGGRHSSFVDNIVGYDRYKLGLTNKLEGIEVLGDYFLKIHFKEVNFSNINNLMFPILNVKQEDVNEKDITKIRNKNFLNGTGKYYIKEYNKNCVSLKLKENELNKKIKLKNIELYFLSENEAINYYINGKIDILYKFNILNNIEQKYKKRIQEYSYSFDNESKIYDFLGFNKNSKIFDDKVYRKSLRDTLNIKKIIEQKYSKGMYSFIDIPIYKNSWFNKDKIMMKKGRKMIDVFKDKYKKSGKYFVDINGYIVTIKLIVQKDNQFFNTIKETLKKQLESQGFKLKIDYLTGNDMFNYLREKKDFDIFVSKRNMTELPKSYDKEIYNIEDSYTLTSDIENLFLYLKYKIKNNIHDTEIQYMVKEWKKSFEKEVPYIVLAVKNNKTLINNRIKGIYINEFIGIDNIENLTNIYFED